ncbi:hypothetical protein HanIR_Chr09g0392601 [Helianthus annuus]|nr:hypothetical protein HanIR_Chr09g0392601 [Helianthus annuus]
MAILKVWGKIIKVTKPQGAKQKFTPKLTPSLPPPFSLLSLCFFALVSFLPSNNNHQ